MAAFAVALLVARALTGTLSGRFGEERVLSMSLYAAGATCLVFPFVSSFAALLAVAFALGFALGPGSPLSLVLAYSRAPPSRAGEASGVRQTVNKVVETLMPVVCGSIGTLVGMAPVFWTTALTLALGARLMGSEARRSIAMPDQRAGPQRVR